MEGSGSINKVGKQNNHIHLRGEEVNVSAEKHMKQAYQNIHSAYKKTDGHVLCEVVLFRKKKFVTHTDGEDQKKHNVVDIGHHEPPSFNEFSCLLMDIRILKLRLTCKRIIIN